MKRKFLTATILSLLVMLLFAGTALAGSSGQCGAEGYENEVQWELDDNGVLTISGSGENMMDFEDTDSVPWYGAYISEIVIGEDITHIGAYAFVDCNDVTEVTLPEHLVSIGDGAFGGSALTSVTFPDSVRTIGAHAFEGCLDLAKVKFGCYLETIGDAAFYDTPALEEIELPENINTIGSSAFSSVKKIILNRNAQPTNVSNGAYGVFTSALKEVVYPGDSSRWEEFKDYYNLPENVKVTFGGPCGTEGHENEVTWTLDDNNILTITGTGAMRDYEKYARPWGSAPTKIVVEEGVTHIGENALTFCDDVQSVSLPDTLKSIGAYAFESCSGYNELKIPDSVETIGEYAFRDTYLKKLFLPASLKNVGASIAEFMNCLILSKNAPTTVDVNFLGSYNSQKVFYPGTEDEWEEVKSAWPIPEGIDVMCLYGGTCGAEGDESSVKWAIDWETKVLTVSGTGAMKDFADDDTIALCDNAWNVPWRAYDQVIGKLETAVIEEGVTTIGMNAFSNFDSLKNVTIPGTVTSIGNASFLQCGSLEKIDIPGSVKSIGDRAFCEIESLKDLTLREGLQTIGESAFEYCKGITEITIPSTVTHIGGSAFNCRYLKIVTISAGIEGLQEGTFNSSAPLSDVYFTGSQAEWKNLPESYGIAFSPFYDVTLHYKKSWEIDEEDESKTYYNKNYEHVKGWKKIGKDWYFFDEESAVMQREWQNVSWKGKEYTYCFGENGVMKKNCWIENGGEWHWLGIYGDAMNAQGWKKIGRKWYYFTPETGSNDSHTESGLFTDEATGKVYYLDYENHGAMKTGWVDVEGTEMYFDKYGARANGWTKIDGKWYYFNEDGTEVKKNCWFTDNGKDYYFDADGAMVTDTEVEGRKINKYGVAK